MPNRDRTNAVSLGPGSGAASHARSKAVPATAGWTATEGLPTNALRPALLAAREEPGAGLGRERNTAQQCSSALLSRSPGPGASAPRRVQGTCSACVAPRPAARRRRHPRCMDAGDPFFLSAPFYVRPMCPTVGTYLDAYRALAKRQPAGGARYREDQHVTQRARVAHQAAAAWTRPQALSWQRLAAGQPTAHSTSGAPSPGPQRHAKVVGRIGHEAAGTAGTRHSSGPRLLLRGLRVVEVLLGSTPGGARPCVGALRAVPARAPGGQCE